MNIAKQISTKRKKLTSCKDLPYKSKENVLYLSCRSGNSSPKRSVGEESRFLIKKDRKFQKTTTK